jgi:uncharacterized protein involved in propanediol utilization
LLGVFMMSTSIGSCNGSFGELIQGVLGDTPFLISLPISMSSTAIYFPTTRSEKLLILSTQDKSKTHRACELYLDHFQVKERGTLFLQSQLPEGKGMASSTADIVASLRAIANHYKLPCNETILSRILPVIEPTDSVMYEELVVYDYINGRLLERLGNLPEMILVGIDTGGIVNTTTFNQVPKHYSIEEKEQFRFAVYLLKQGIKNKEIEHIYQAATISAKINEKRLPKPYFKEIYNLAQNWNAGIVSAHSGTVIGILSSNQLTKNDITQILNQIYHLTGKTGNVFKIGSKR